MKSYNRKLYALNSPRYNVYFAYSKFVEKGEYKEPLSQDNNYSSDKNKDNVNHPNHYTGKYECIDVMAETQGIEAVKNFCICNAFKYLWRHGKKNGVEDMKKATWYLNKFIELEERSRQ